jgi:hypothetical protein
MPKLITATAQMQCTLGAQPAKLTVTSQTFIKISDGLVATEDDKTPMSNIPSFGNCKIYPHPPCVPSPQPWQQTTQKDSINGKKKLTEDSFCMCAKGGKISFVNTGKNTFVEGV